MYQNKICLIYQYLLYKGDILDNEKEIALDRLRRSGTISVADFDKIRSAIIRAEVFDEIQLDLFNLLK